MISPRVTIRAIVDHSSFYWRQTAQKPRNASLFQIIIHDKTGQIKSSDLYSEKLALFVGNGEHKQEKLDDFMGITRKTCPNWSKPRGLAPGDAQGACRFKRAMRPALARGPLRDCSLTIRHGDGTIIRKSHIAFSLKAMKEQRRLLRPEESRHLVQAGGGQAGYLTPEPPA